MVVCCSVDWLCPCPPWQASRPPETFELLISQSFSLLHWFVIANMKVIFDASLILKAGCLPFNVALELIFCSVCTICCFLLHFFVIANLSRLPPECGVGSDILSGQVADQKRLCQPCSSSWSPLLRKFCKVAYLTQIYYHEFLPNQSPLHPYGLENLVP